MKQITSLVLLLLLTVGISFAQNKTVTFRAYDKVLITADLYTPNPATSTMIILFHQAKYSRGEYKEIAPKLNAMGFNCMAVDLRSGEAVNGIDNRTWLYCDSLGLSTGFTDAYYDVQAAVKYVKSKFQGAKVILFGSSYSASLALKYAGDYPKTPVGVIAFSPAEYFSKYGWSRTVIQTTAARITCPVFIASNSTEKDRWQGIYNAVPTQTKSFYMPGEGGKHGAKSLWESFPESKGYWTALKSFLKKY